MGDGTFSLIVENNIVFGYSGKSKVIEIPDGITEIHSNAFANCDFVKEIYIHSSSLYKIGASSFSNCTHLEKIEIQSLAGSIEEEAFYGCSALQSVVIPDGAIKIGSFAFAACTNLLFIAVPSSVILIGDSIVDNKTIILGAASSDIAVYASQNMLSFEENTKEIRSKLIARNYRSDNIGYKDFIIYGEPIRCYKSIAPYQKVLDFFHGLNISFLNEANKNVPSSLYSDFDSEKTLALDQTYIEKVNEFLKSFGIYLNQVYFDAKTIEYSANYLSTCKAIFNAYTEICKALKTGKEEMEAQYIDEAESQITGLNYGVIGNQFTLVLHAFDEAMEVHRQSKKAYRDAQEKIEKTSHHMKYNANKIYKKFMAETGYPALKKSVEYICAGLMNFVVEELIQANKLNKKIIEVYDVAQSNKIIEQARNNDHIDKHFAVASALALYPFNVKAYALVMYEKDLFDLIEYSEVFLSHSFIKLLKKTFDYVSLCTYLENNKKYMGPQFLQAVVSVKSQKELALVNSIRNGLRPNQISFETWKTLVKNYYSKYPDEFYEYDVEPNELLGPDAQNQVAKAMDYKKAINLMEKAKQDRDFQKPLEIFQRLGNYRDSAEKESVCAFNVHFEDNYFKTHLEQKNKLNELLNKPVEIQKKAKRNYLILLALVVIPCVLAWGVYNGHFFWLRLPQVYLDFFIDFGLIDGVAPVICGLSVVVGLFFLIKNKKKVNVLVQAYQRKAELYRLTTLKQNVPFNKSQYNDQIREIESVYNSEIWTKLKKARQKNIFKAVLAVVIVALVITTIFGIVPFINYRKAVNFESAGRIEDAYINYNKALTIPGSRKHAKELSYEMQSSALENAKVGSVVKFGTYYLTVDLFSGKGEIEWVVLKKEDNKLLLLSLYAIDRMQFDSSTDDALWPDSSLRKTLNTDFIDDAFSEQQSQLIVDTTLVTNNVTTQDKVFLLSESEYQQYNEEGKIPALQHTEYAKARDGQGASYYSGDYDNTVYMRDSENYKATKDGIRPAIWLDLNNL